MTGKGGTGKTTVAAALALALAAGGKRVLLCEVEGRQGIASVFDVAPLPYDERRVAVAPDGGQVWALAIDAEAAFLEYLQIFYHLGRAGKLLDKFGVVDFATTIAPGARDVLLTGKVYEAARRRKHERPVYDAIVLDAPPTGRVGRFLNVNSDVAGIAKVGPIRNQATSIMDFLRSPQTRVQLVSSLEEMPVQEVLDSYDEMHDIGLAVGGIVVNFARESELTKTELANARNGRLDLQRIGSALKEAGINGGDSALAALEDEARQHAERVAIEAKQRRRLQDTGCPIVELPEVSEGVDLGTLYDFADRLRDCEAIS